MVFRGKLPLIRWLPVVAWMGVIFFFSTDMGGGERTSRFLGPLIRWVAPGISKPSAEAAEFAIRKLAHVAEYAVLAGLIARAQGLARPASGPMPPKDALLVLTLSTFYAITDEIHQSFVPGRIGTAADVFIDFLGASMGLMVVALWRGASWRKAPAP